jgi:hypothetical protein
VALAAAIASSNEPTRRTCSSGANSSSSATVSPVTSTSPGETKAPLRPSTEVMARTVSPGMALAPARAMAAARSEISGPMNGSSRPFHGPITSRSESAATASITARPAASSETISRRAHEQRWPVVMKADCTTRAAAASASPASQTTSGLLPPSSSARITSGRSAKWRGKRPRRRPSR